MPESGASKEALYVGIDDSNHAGQDMKGEIIVATFSYDADDGEVRRQCTRRDSQRVSSWLEQACHDYRFTILSDEDSYRRGYNVVLIAPLLIRAYVAEQQAMIGKLSIFCDGPLKAHQKRYLRKHFSEYKIYAEGFIKKSWHQGKLQSSHLMPYVVAAADTWAHGLYLQPLEALAKNTRMVAVSAGTVAEYDQQLRGSMQK